MRNFRFSLEKILSWRRAELLVQEARLAALFAERSRLDARRAEIRAVRQSAAGRLLASGTVDGRELESLQSYRERLERELMAFDRRRVESAEQISCQQARVVDARRRVRLLEKLKGRRMEEWLTEWQREVETFASEAFLARWNRH